jgi:hypothetical protein
MQKLLTIYHMSYYETDYRSKLAIQQVIIFYLDPLLPPLSPRQRYITRMIDQMESAGSKVLNCDLTRSKIIKSLYIQTKGKDHGDGKHMDDKKDLRNLALSFRVAFHHSKKYLWNEVTQKQVNTLYRQEADAVSRMALHNASCARFLIIRPFLFNFRGIATN